MHQKVALTHISTYLFILYCFMHIEGLKTFLAGSLHLWQLFQMIATYCQQLFYLATQKQLLKFQTIWTTITPIPFFFIFFLYVAYIQFKNYTIKVRSPCAFYSTEGLPRRCSRKKGIICQVDLNWGLIALMPSLHEMTILIWLERTHTLIADKALDVYTTYTLFAPWCKQKVTLLVQFTLNQKLNVTRIIIDFIFLFTYVCQ